MPQKIVDLSDLLSEDKRVRFRPGGKVYTLPGDLPAELFLLIQREGERQLEAISKGEQVAESQVVQSLTEQLLRLFQHGDPSMTALPSEITLAQMLGLISRLYGDEEPPASEGRARPSRAGTRSTSRPRKRPSSR